MNYVVFRRSNIKTFSGIRNVSEMLNERDWTEGGFSRWADQIYMSLPYQPDSTFYKIYIR